MIKLCQDIHQKFGFIIYIKIMEISFCHIRDMQKKKKNKKVPRGNSHGKNDRVQQRTMLIKENEKMFEEDDEVGKGGA